ncbi:UPF0758 protein [Trichinella pseudospiralis]
MLFKSGDPYKLQIIEPWPSGEGKKEKKEIRNHDHLIRLAPSWGVQKRKQACQVPFCRTALMEPFTEMEIDLCSPGRHQTCRSTISFRNNGPI